ncbi:hypothetical protein [Mycetocola sp. JXN-3]|uniref:hypothetical protein n=1 Tax=Mycetocola sp. JXN-3 TaxID=2116510 RepID=UPI00165CF9E8|nr:hypothetical protein [Mycetocola sp. JXN-3]
MSEHSGVTAQQAMAMTLKEQYQRAGGQYRELNERLGELQKEINAGEWLDGSVESEVIPGQGYVLGSGLAGETKENSYYFNASRWRVGDEDLSSTLPEASRAWEARGWEVNEESFRNDSSRITTTTPEGFRFEVMVSPGEVKLSGHTPVHWGDQFALLTAIAERRDAENAAGAPWDTTDRDDQGYAYRLPGVFRPFPAWDAIAAE